MVAIPNTVNKFVFAIESHSAIGIQRRQTRSHDFVFAIRGRQARQRLGIQQSCSGNVSAIEFCVGVSFQFVGKFNVVGVGKFFPSRR